MSQAMDPWSTKKKVSKLLDLKLGVFGNEMSERAVSFGSFPLARVRDWAFGLQLISVNFNLLCFLLLGPCKITH